MARLWDESTHRIVVSGDVKFQEDIFPAFNHPNSPKPNNDLRIPSFDDNELSPDLSSVSNSPQELVTDTSTPEVLPESNFSPVDDDTPSSSPAELLDDTCTVPESSPALTRRSTRQTQVPVR